MRKAASISQLGLIVVFLLMAASVMAQMNPMDDGMGNGMNGGMQGHHSHNRGGTHHANAAANQPDDPNQQIFSALETKLKLTEAQWPLWESYQDKVGALHADLMRASGGEAVANDNAVMQIGRKTDALRNRLAAMEDISDAARTLYQALTPEQQKIADTLLATTIPNLYGNLGQAPLRSRTTDRSGAPPTESGSAPPPRPN